MIWYQDLIRVYGPFRVIASPLFLLADAYGVYQVVSTGSGGLILLLALLVQLIILLTATFLREREERRLRLERDEALDVLTRNLGPTTSGRVNEMSSKYEIHPNGDTHQDHALCLEVVHGPAYFSTFGAGGNKPRRRLKVDVTSGDVRQAHRIKRSEREGESGQRYEDAVAEYYFLEAVETGNTKTINIAFTWPKQNPEIGKGKRLTYEWTVGKSAVDSWHFAFIIHQKDGSPGAIACEGSGWSCELPSYATLDLDIGRFAIEWTEQDLEPDAEMSVWFEPLKKKEADL